MPLANQMPGGLIAGEGGNLFFTTFHTFWILCYVCILPRLLFFFLINKRCWLFKVTVQYRLLPRGGTKDTKEVCYDCNVISCFSPFADSLSEWCPQMKASPEVVHDRCRCSLENKVILCVPTALSTEPEQLFLLSSTVSWLQTHFYPNRLSYLRVEGLIYLPSLCLVHSRQCL